MYGELAEKLIQDARRAINLDRLGLYQSDIVRAVTREVLELDYRIEKLAEKHEDISLSSQNRMAASAHFMYKLAQFRSKRCMLAYHSQRATKLEQDIWAEQDLDAQTLGNLSPAEQEYIREYTDLVVDFKSEFSDIDLTGSLDPPTNMYVEVRVLKDAGEIQTEYGVFNLTKDSQFFVRQADVQRLIQQGLVQLV